MIEFTPNPQCKKCTSYEVKFEYNNEYDPVAGRRIEWLHCTCKKCGYEWEMEIAE